MISATATKKPPIKKEESSSEESSSDEERAKPAPVKKGIKAIVFSNVLLTLVEYIAQKIKTFKKYGLSWSGHIDFVSFVENMKLLHIEEGFFYSATPAKTPPAKKEESGSEESSSDEEEAKPVGKATGDKTKGKKRKSIFKAVMISRLLS